MSGMTDADLLSDLLVGVEMDRQYLPNGGATVAALGRAIARLRGEVAQGEQAVAFGHVYRVVVDANHVSALAPWDKQRGVVFEVGPAEREGVDGHIQYLNLYTRPQPAAVAGDAVAFQSRVSPWMQECFGPAVAADVRERGDRLLEEVLELLQSHGYDPSRVAALRDYVFGRPVGEPQQEVGGVMVTLAAYCLATGIDMHHAGETELARISAPEVVERIRVKQASKNGLHTPLPVPPASTAAPVAVPDEAAAYEAWFLSQQGTAYDGAWSFARAAWMHRAALPPTSGQSAPAATSTAWAANGPNIGATAEASESVHRGTTEGSTNA